MIHWTHSTLKRQYYNVDGRDVMDSTVPRCRTFMYLMVHASLLPGGVCFMAFPGLMSACSLVARWSLFHDLPGPHERMQSCCQVGFVSWSSRASWAHAVLLAGGVCFMIFLGFMRAHRLVDRWGLFHMVQGCSRQLSVAYGTVVVSCSGGGLPQWARKWTDHMASTW